MIMRLILFTLAGAFTSCMAQIAGDAKQTCSTPLVPSDANIKPQEGPSPYTVTVQHSGDKINVNISSEKGETFKEFILQARSASNKDKVIAGEFKTDNTSKTINCSEHEKSTLTQKDNTTKSRVTTEWTGVPDEDIIFRATVVKDKNIFWKDIDSIEVNKKESDKDKDSNDFNDCSEPKHCVGMPEKCVEHDNCEVLFKFEDNGDESIKCSLKGELKVLQYMAVVISEDQNVGDDSVIACYKVTPNDKNESIIIEKSRNEGNQKIGAVQVVSDFIPKNEMITCMWNQPRVFKLNETEYDLPNKPYILLARGQVEEGKMLLTRDSKLASSEPVELFAPKTVNPNNNGVDVKPDKELEAHSSPEVDQSPEPTSMVKSAVAPNSCSKLNLGLFWLAVLVFYVSGRNVLNLI